MVLAAAGCVLVITTGSDTQAAPGEPQAVSTGTTDLAPPPVVAAVADTADTEAGPVTPRHLSIPGIDVRTPLVGLGLQHDGTVEVPGDPDQAGWFDLGPTPGDLGSSVLLGHVDSIAGPAVFARLSELERGSRVTVRLSDHSIVRFVVRRVRTYANADFPARKVYQGHGRSTLTLVTCGGSYDRARGGYQSNVVVYTERLA